MTDAQVEAALKAWSDARVHGFADEHRAMRAALAAATTVRKTTTREEIDALFDLNAQLAECRAALAAAQAGDGTQDLKDKAQWHALGYEQGIGAAAKSLPGDKRGWDDAQRILALRPPAPADNETCGWSPDAFKAASDENATLSERTLMNSADSRERPAPPPLSASEPAGARTWRTLVEEEALTNIEDWCGDGGPVATLGQMEELAKMIAESIPSSARNVEPAGAPSEDTRTLAAKILRCLKWHYGAEASDKDSAAEQLIADLITERQLALLRRGGKQ